MIWINMFIILSLLLLPLRQDWVSFHVQSLKFLFSNRTWNHKIVLWISHMLLFLLETCVKLDRVLFGNFSYSIFDLRLLRKYIIQSSLNGNFRTILKSFLWRKLDVHVFGCCCVMYPSIIRSSLMLEELSDHLNLLLSSFLIVVKPQL